MRNWLESPTFTSWFVVGAISSGNTHSIFRRLFNLAIPCRNFREVYVLHCVHLQKLSDARLKELNVSHCYLFGGSYVAGAKSFQVIPVVFMDVLVVCKQAWVLAVSPNSAGSAEAKEGKALQVGIDPLRHRQ